MKTGTVMNFSLYGGPADGALVCHPLLEPGQLYLVTIPQEDGRRLVHAYAFANRTDAAGTWVLRHERYVGFQGIGKVES